MIDIIVIIFAQLVASLICRESNDYYTMQMYLDKAIIGMGYVY